MFKKTLKNDEKVFVWKSAKFRCFLNIYKFQVYLYVKWSRKWPHFCQNRTNLTNFERPQKLSNPLVFVRKSVSKNLSNFRLENAKKTHFFYTPFFETFLVQFPLKSISQTSKSVKIWQNLTNPDLKNVPDMAFWKSEAQNLTKMSRKHPHMSMFLKTWNLSFKSDIFRFICM